MAARALKDSVGRGLPDAPPKSFRRSSRERNAEPSNSAIENYISNLWQHKKRASRSQCRSKSAHSTGNARDHALGSTPKLCLCPVSLHGYCYI